MVVNHSAFEIFLTRLIERYERAKENNNKKLGGIRDVLLYLILVGELAVTSVGI
jgi:hypothetical protein